MPSVQYSYKGKKLEKDMPVPKKVSRMDAWYNTARKSIPEIPELKSGQWIIHFQEANLEYVRFEITDRLRTEKRHVLIFRNRGSHR